MKKRTISRKSQTDWKRVDALSDLQIDFSDAPELTPQMFARAIVRRGLKPIGRKRQLTIRVDNDVREWYKKQGPGYQTRINALLRAYMQEHRRKAVSVQGSFMAKEARELREHVAAERRRWR